MSLKGLVSGANKGPLIIAGILILFVSAVITYLVISLILARRKVQALASKTRKMEEDIARLKEEEKLAEEIEKQARLRALITELEAKLAVHKNDLQRLKKDHDNYVKSIDEVTSWDDLEVAGP